MNCVLCTRKVYGGFCKAHPSQAKLADEIDFNHVTPEESAAGWQKQRSQQRTQRRHSLPHAHKRTRMHTCTRTQGHTYNHRLTFTEEGGEQIKTRDGKKQGRGGRKAKQEQDQQRRAKQRGADQAEKNNADQSSDTPEQDTAEHPRGRSSAATRAAAS